VTLTFLTPLGVLLVLGALVPLAFLFAARRQGGKVRAGLGVREPAFRRLLVGLGSTLAAGALIGLAAAQPIVESETEHEVRTDAEVFLVLDVSRSMLAQESPSAAMRMDRAKSAASAFRASLPEVRVGVASLTDRVLPHLFPSASEDVFEATLERAIDIEKPPPRSSLATNVTSLDALAGIRGLQFFSPTAPERLLVVLTDGESVPVQHLRLGGIMRRQPPIETIFVHVWGSDEHVFNRGAREPQYRVQRGSRKLLELLASSTGGRVYAEDEIEQAVARARGVLGDGPTAVEGETGKRLPLAPYLAALAILPLGLVLWRRDR
jgi:hypothetical protein